MATFYSDRVSGSATSLTSVSQVGAGKGRGRLRVASGTYTSAAGGETTSDWVLLHGFKSNVVIWDLNLYVDTAFTGGATSICGLLTSTTGPGGTLTEADDNAFRLTVDVNTGGRIDGLTGVAGTTLFGKYLWEVAALSEDPGPGTDFYVGLQPGGTNWAVGGDIIFAITYSSGD